MAPVFDPDRKPFGLIIAASVFHFLTRRMPGRTDQLGQAAGGLPFGWVLATPYGDAIDRMVHKT